MAVIIALKRERNHKNTSRMDNLEILATFGTRHRTKTNKTKNATQKTNRMSNTDPTKTL